MSPPKTLFSAICALALTTTAFGATSDTEYHARQDGFSLSQKTLRIEYSENSSSAVISLSLLKDPDHNNYRRNSLCLIDHDYKPSSGKFSVDEIYNGDTYERCHKAQTYKCSEKAINRADQIFLEKMKELDLLKNEKRWLSEKDDIILGKWAD